MARHRLDDGDIGYIVGVLRTSGYSLATLRDIYLLEVAPVVSGNLHTPAGAWSGFDPEWLYAQVGARAGRRGRWSRLWVRWPPVRWYRTYATAAPWRRIEAELTEAAAPVAPPTAP